MQAADRYSGLSAKMLDNKRRMLHFYNTTMSGGKWEGILTPESFPPPPTALYPARKPALQIKGSALRVDLWNGEEVLKFSSYGRRQKWLELGNQGAGSIPYTIEVQEGAEWITLSESSGSLHDEQRIIVSVSDPAAHAGQTGLIAIQDHRNSSVLTVKVEIEENPRLSADFSGYVETDGYVSMPASGYEADSLLQGTDSNGERYGWITIPGMGRYVGAAMMAWHSAGQPPEGGLQQQPYLEYGFYLPHGGQYALELHRFLTLDSTGRIRWAISIDDAEPFIAESATTDEWKGNWQDCIMNNGEKLRTQLPDLSAGAHKLKLYMVDRYVTFSKLVLYASGEKATNLGPAYSLHTRRNPETSAGYGAEGPEVDWNGVEQLCTELYHTALEEVPLPPVLYTDREFYEELVHQIFLRCRAHPQAALGAARYADFGGSTQEKNITDEFGTGRFMEAGGILAIEAEYALENSEHAYLTPARTGGPLVWSHLQAETNGRTGYAMHVAEPGMLWTEPGDAPGMHYQVSIHSPGVYHVWLLLRHHNSQSDSCYLALDGLAQPLSEQFNKGKLHTYNTAQVYYWCHMSDLKLTAGEHELSILARKSQLRIDRLYLTRGGELPPADAYWQDSLRQ
ncbi:hypothetical protein D3C73_693670 [compost metagenome]